MSDSSPGIETWIDRIATQFDRAWHEGRRPAIEDYLGDSTGPRLQQLLGELLRIELQHRVHLGESPPAAEYERRFPDQALVVRAAFRSEGQRTGTPGDTPPTASHRPGHQPGGNGDDTASYSFRKPDGRVVPLVDPEGHATLRTVFPPGTILQDRYVVEDELGHGAMGLVYRGRALHLGDRPVAIKVILPDAERGTIGEADVRAAFEQEARLGANLVHPAIATVYDFGLHNDIPFTVFEYIPGETLGSLLRRRGRLPLDEVRLIVGALAQALDFAHSRHIIHRDLKPENIRATEQGQFKVLDLGLARRFLQAGDWSGFAGTPAYAAPEQAAGLPCDGRADQYALALIAYELLTGHRPFTAGTIREMLEKHRFEAPPVPRTSPPLSAPAASALLKALHKDPAQRFNSCEEFALALGCRLLSAVNPEARIEAEGAAYDARHLPRWLASLFPEMSRVHLMLTADALWMFHRGSIVKWPRRYLREFSAHAPGYLQMARGIRWSIPDDPENRTVLSFLVKDTEQEIPVSLHFASSAECQEWCRHLLGCGSKEWRDRILGPIESIPVKRTQTLGVDWILAVSWAIRLIRRAEPDPSQSCATKAEPVPPLLGIDPCDVRKIISPIRMGDDDPTQPAAIEEHRPVALLSGRPIHRHQVLGPVEVVHDRKSTADAKLQLRAAMAGADAVMGIQRERLRGYDRNLTRVSGLAILAVDHAGRGELRTRWFARQLLVFCRLTLIYIMSCIIISGLLRHYVLLRGSEPQGTLVFVSVLYGVPLAIILLMTVLRWPQLMRGVAIAIIFVAAACLGVMLASAIPAGLRAYGRVERIVGEIRGSGRRKLAGLILLFITFYGAAVWYQFRFGAFLSRLLLRVRHDYRMVASNPEEPRARRRSLVGHAVLSLAVIHAVSASALILASILGYPDLGIRLGVPSTSPFPRPSESVKSSVGEDPVGLGTPLPMQSFEERVISILNSTSLRPSLKESIAIWQSNLYGTAPFDVRPQLETFLLAERQRNRLETVARESRLMKIEEDLDQLFNDALEKEASAPAKEARPRPNLAEIVDEHARLIAIEWIASTTELRFLKARPAPAAKPIDEATAIARQDVQEIWQDSWQALIPPSVLLAKELVKAYPSNPDYWNTLGLTQYAAEDYRSAVESLEQAAKLRPKGAHPDKFVLAAVRWHLGDRERAEDHYRKAVEWMEKHEPQNKDLAHLRSHVETLINGDQ